MPAQADAPKVFISYSWKPAQHQQRVIALAERLMSDGVNVTLDVWDLREGQDKNQFMERMVTDSDIKRVLLICNKDYKEKADSRTGGVGTESMIMSSEIYAKAEQTNFVPLIFEADESGHAYTPVFVRSRIYLDFSREEVVEDSYEQLIRNIFDKPTHRRLPLGIAPSYLKDTEPNFLATAHQVSTIKRAFLDERRNAPLLVKHYYSAFLAAVAAFEPKENEFDNANFIELTLARMEQMKPLRDDFVLFLETYLEVAPDFDRQVFFTFLENYAMYLYNKAIVGFDTSGIKSLSFDYLRFFTYELLLCFTAVLLRLEKFSLLAEFTHNTFIIIQQHGEPKEVDFRFFNLPIATLNSHQNDLFKMNRISVVADNIKQRASLSYSFDELKQADIILHYISELSNFTPNAYSRSYWKPETSAYNTYNLPILAKMVSVRYFDKIKVLFEVENKEELENKIKTFESDSFSQLWFRSEYFMRREIPMLSYLINTEKVGTMK